MGRLALAARILLFGLIAISPLLPELTTCAWARPVEIPLATPVNLRFDSPVEPVSHPSGTTVTLTVVDDVRVGEDVVIASGTKATGEVTTSKKTGALGKPAELVVTVRTVPAVDGRPVPVSATMSKEGESKVTTAIVVAVLCCILGLLIKGGKTTIPEGATVKAAVLAPTVVEVP